MNSIELENRNLMQLFLDKNYITLKELAKQCQVETSNILALENAQCIPGHTYEKRQVTLYTCAGIDEALSENSSLETTFYYHNSIINWVNEALKSINEMDLTVLANKVKMDFANQIEKYLKGQKTPGCQSFDQAWRYWIDGTWGKCLKTISVECLAKKELARKYIADTMNSSAHEISYEQKNKLVEAIENYIQASLEFDPYGMRHKVALDPIEKFNLNVTINKTYMVI